MRPSEIVFVSLYLLTFAAVVAFIQGYYDGRRVPLEQLCRADRPSIFMFGWKGGFE